eukprot:TRINITY_DN17735_c0_g1_i1.p1 TRINITY_DN17735_c0_g1~~TRINITY_DN17735_c0_g1_i1.p1  ORF type:complete len:291 (-),score=48.15 TRINITY_DN17735_c0_g1_i1:67-939(-)
MVLASCTVFWLSLTALIVASPEECAGGECAADLPPADTSNFSVEAALQSIFGKLEEMRQGQEELRQEMRQGLKDLRQEMAEERKFAVRAVQRLQNCSFTAANQEVIASGIVVRVAGVNFAATAAHVAEWLQTQHHSAWSHLPWCLHPIRDLGIAVIDDQTLKASRLVPCPLNAPSFEIGERVTLFSRAHDRAKAASAMVIGTVNQDIPLLVGNETRRYNARQGDLVIDADVHGGWSGCTASNHELLGVVTGSIPCVDGGSRDCGVVVPAHHVVGFAANLIAGRMEACTLG